MSKAIISRDPQVMSGTAVFAGTRVPTMALFDYIETGESVDEFLDDFPGVSKDQVLGLLGMARQNLTGIDEAAA